MPSIPRRMNILLWKNLFAICKVITGWYVAPLIKALEIVRSFNLGAVVKIVWNVRFNFKAILLGITLLAPPLSRRIFLSGY